MPSCRVNTIRKKTAENYLQKERSLHELMDSPWLWGIYSSNVLSKGAHGLLDFLGVLSRRGFRVFFIVLIVDRGNIVGDWLVFVMAII